jgi:hypothetical protein
VGIYVFFDNRTIGMNRELQSSQDASDESVMTCNLKHR